MDPEDEELNETVETPVAEVEPAEKSTPKRKKKGPKMPRKPKAEETDEKTHTGVRISIETSQNVNRLAALMQIDSGEITRAGDAIAYAVELALSKRK